MIRRVASLGNYNLKLLSSCTCEYLTEIVYFCQKYAMQKHAYFDLRKCMKVLLLLVVVVVLL